MNAQDYLLRQGWAGPGTPLNPTRQRAGGPHGGLGLTKPILVARRKGNEGVGKKTTKDPTNQWWLRGFEDALKGVSGEGDRPNGGGQTGRTPNALTSELYRFFVRGEGLAGTVGVQNQDKEKEKEKVKGKRKRNDEDGDKSEKKKKKKRKDKDESKESKEERRQRKLEKRLKKERKAEEGVSKHKEKKSKKESKPEDNYPTPASTEHDSSGQDEAVKVKHSKSKDKTDKTDKKDMKTKTSSGDDKARKSKKTKKDKSSAV